MAAFNVSWWHWHKPLLWVIDEGAVPQTTNRLPYRKEICQGKNYEEKLESSRRGSNNACSTFSNGRKGTTPSSDTSRKLHLDDLKNNVVCSKPHST